MDGSLLFSADGHTTGPSSEEVLSLLGDSSHGPRDIGVVSTSRTPRLEVKGSARCGAEGEEDDDAGLGAAWAVSIGAGLGEVSSGWPKRTEGANAAGGFAHCSSKGRGWAAGGSVVGVSCEPGHPCPHLKLSVRPEQAKSVRAVVLEGMAGMGKGGVVVPIPEIGDAPAPEDLAS